MFEVGCGVGNTIYPLREEFPDLFFYGCDLSPRAVDLVKVSMLSSLVATQFCTVGFIVSFNADIDLN